MAPSQPLRPPLPVQFTASGQTSTAGSYGFPGDAISHGTTTRGTEDSFAEEEEGDSDEDDASSSSSSSSHRAPLRLPKTAAPTPVNTVNNDPFGTRSFISTEPVGVRPQVSAVSFESNPPYSAPVSSGFHTFPSSSSSPTSSSDTPTASQFSSYRLPDPTHSALPRGRARSIQTLPSSTHGLSPLPSPVHIPHSTIPIPPPPPTLSHNTSWTTASGSGFGSAGFGASSNSDIRKLKDGDERMRTQSTISRISNKFGSRVRLLSFLGSTPPPAAPSLPGGGGIEMTVSPSTSGASVVEQGGDVGHNEPKAVREKRHRDEQFERDQRRLEQLGYSQVLGRDYGFWSSFSISFCNIGFLQGTLSGVLTTFAYGGPSMILTMWPVSFVVITLITLSMGELASTYPVAGAMASWAWKCARGGARRERGWGWVISGITLGFHVCVMCLLMYQLATLVLNIISLALPNTSRADWHILVLYFGVCLLAGIFGSIPAGRSPKFWVGSLIFLVSVWFILCVALLAKGTKTSPSEVFGGDYENEAGFTSKTMVYIVGWVLCTVATGADGSAHVAEETQNPSRTVPLAMLASVVATYVMGYISIFILLLAIDPTTIQDAMAHPYPTGLILQQSLGLKGAVGISSLVAIAVAIQTVAQLQASSRFVFAIARDDAVPFGQILQRTNKSKMPIIATWVFLGSTLPIGFALWQVPGIAGSVLSLGGGTLCLVSYGAPIGLYLWSKMDLQTEGRTDWSLRKWSRPVGYVAILGSLAIVIAMTLPSSYPVTAETFSWSVTVTIGTLLLTFITWRLYGNEHYSGPVKALTKWEAGGEIDLQTTLARTTDVNGVSLGKFQEDPNKTGYFGPSVVTVSTQPTTGKSGTAEGSGSGSGSGQGSAQSPTSMGSLKDPDTSMTGLLPSSR